MNPDGTKNISLLFYGAFKHWIKFSNYEYKRGDTTSIIIMNSKYYDNISWMEPINSMSQENWDEIIRLIEDETKNSHYTSIGVDSTFYYNGIVVKYKNDFKRLDYYFIGYRYEDYIYSGNGLLEKLLYKGKSGLYPNVIFNGYFYKYEYFE